MRAKLGCRRGYCVSIDVDSYCVSKLKKNIVGTSSNHQLFSLKKVGLMKQIRFFFARLKMAL